MSKKRIVDSMKVAKPCSADWNEMFGNDQVRFCKHCSKNVNNISTMTRKDAVKLVRRSNGSLCIRYYTDPQTQKPMFLENFVQISRRAPRIAAGVMSASLSLATLTYGQTQSPQSSERPVVEQINKQPSPQVNDDGPAIIKEPEDFIALSGEMVVRVQHKGSLARAVAEEDLDKVRNLVNSGEDVNSKEEDKTTPLIIAVENGNVELAELLLNFGADVNARTLDEESVLMKLDYDSSKELVELLIRNGAKVDLKDSNGNTALILTARNGKAEVLEALINSGASINERNSVGETALMNAAYSTDVASIQTLLTAGADVNAKDDSGETALMIAADHGAVEAVRALLESGANANLVSNEGQTALDKTDNEEIRSMLMSFGAVPKSN